MVRRESLLQFRWDEDWLRAVGFHLPAFLLQLNGFSDVGLDLADLDFLYRAETPLAKRFGLPFLSVDQDAVIIGSSAPWKNHRPTYDLKAPMSTTILLLCR